MVTQTLNSSFWTRVASWGVGSASLVDKEAFHQQRVALYAKTLSLLVIVLFFVDLGVSLAVIDELTVLLFVYWILGYFGLILPFALVWFLCARSDRPTWALNLMEGGCTFFACNVCAMGIVSLHYEWPENPIGYLAVSVMFLGVILFLVMRAAIVPSSTVQTLLVGLISIVPSVFATHFSFDRSIPWGKPVSPTDAAGVIAVWGAIFIAITAVISKIIYGLQARVHEAMQMGQYTLEERIGQGGMGVVYRARHALLRRPTALKLLPPEIAGERAIRRFETEVQQTSRLTHPNTVSIYDYGRTVDGVFYYAMEYLDGVSLQELPELDGPQPPGRVIYILSQAAHALAAAHAEGLVHRDIKPANILLVEHGGVADLVKLVDFGLVRDMSTDTVLSRASTDGLEGTPLYTPPEALTTPSEVDGRSDLYSLGGVGYYLLCGAPPFDGRTSVEVFSKHLHEQPAPPSAKLGTLLPDDLEALIMLCLAKKPEDRPADARDLWKALRTCRDAEAWNLHEAEQWWKQNRKVIERARQDARQRDAHRQRPPDGHAPPTPTVAIPRRAFDK